ncbi:CRISPR-associated protein Csm3 [Aequitasia blattaphilus]|uniref:RAMP superfamily CRISPR-associated protein n=1 Tax=Aequitasia blattaphilus TaxID=2949332 RepID=A0ABT1E870_9FIRM|nr:RAMP superfamily CRISPR-associated protein [Aequitasia blattaphilus]MCP1102034.1 RAMP superfamily CRISPR-associated protein [Aequitasia blattaphilus]MCR8614674.1 RAMP superfamily CRISPR-associated protein [Aequitasia blattaphilus]
MSDNIRIKIRLQSNLYIGGAPSAFEIGGIDQTTVVDQEGFPYIPASTLKGAFRNIVHQEQSENEKKIAKLYRDYIQKMKTDNIALIRNSVEKEELERIEQRYEIYLDEDMPLSEYIFGMKGFNNTPKLLFDDFKLSNDFRNVKQCFSIDMKAEIKNEDNKILSNPRTYKVARCGLEFEGMIRFYKIESLSESANQICRKNIIANLKKFNEGVYRLGNSKSRGYGRIEVIIEEQEGME